MNEVRRLWQTDIKSGNLKKNGWQFDLLKCYCTCIKSDGRDFRRSADNFQLSAFRFFLSLSLYNLIFDCCGPTFVSTSLFNCQILELLTCAGNIESPWQSLEVHVCEGKSRCVALDLLFIMGSSSRGKIWSGDASTTVKSTSLNITSKLKQASHGWTKIYCNMTSCKRWVLSYICLKISILYSRVGAGGGGWFKSDKKAFFLNIFLDIIRTHMVNSLFNIKVYWWLLHSLGEYLILTGQLRQF